MNRTALAVTASVQHESSISRKLVNDLVAHLEDKGEIDTLIERDLSVSNLELLTSDHVLAFYTPADERNEFQKKQLAQSDQLIAELKQARTLIIGTPMYNFSVPAALKAWIDLVCRAGESFRYSENGPVGLLDIDTTYLVVATGGAPVNSAVDFVVPYLTQVAKFIGSKRVEVVAADRLNAERPAAIQQAREQIAAI